MPTRAQVRQAELAARQQQTQLVAQLTATTMSGPLPAPNLLEEYERISPGAASIIISEFQLQAQHRRTQESRIVMSDIIRAYIGQGIGCALAAYLIWTGGDLLRHGQSITGFQSIGLAIATGAVPFAIKAYTQHQERKNQTNAIAAQQQPGNQRRA